MSEVEDVEESRTHVAWRIAASVVGLATLGATAWLVLRALSFEDTTATGTDAYMSGDLIGLSAGALLLLGTGAGIATGLWRGRLWAKVVLIGSLVLAGVAAYYLHGRG
ncbi:hypothetical protein [Demequina salsinemoris]|uniref:hypothetical protein n=1 Tax=Demequina salsinemoris TaxID=577470 RepID=UPI0007838B56|nr:hypothetical protein [Demequina salsinemoris]